MTIGLAIIGAGPAGMAAAVLAAELGIETALIDEQASPGGQIYRGVERSRPELAVRARLPSRPRFDRGATRQPRRVPAENGLMAYRSRRHSVPRKQRPRRGADGTRNPARHRRLRAACPDPGMDPPRRHGGRRGADPAEVSRPRPGRPRRAGGTGTASLSDSGAARAGWRTAGSAPRDDAIGELPRGGAAGSTASGRAAECSPKDWV